MSKPTPPTTSMRMIDVLRGRSPSLDAERDQRDFYRLYYPVILTWCLKSGLQQADAEEVSQLVLVKLYCGGKLGSYTRSRGRFRWWLKALVLHQVVDWLRKAGRRPRPCGPEVLEAARAPEPAESNPDAVEGWFHGARDEVVGRVRARVHANTWEAFHRVRLQGMPAGEVAAELGVLKGCVEVAVNRVGKMLREEWEKLLKTNHE